MLRNEKGMNLIEIMIVMVIIGGLLSVIGTTVFNALDKSKIGTARIQISEISKALEMYSTDCKSFPSTDVGLSALIQAPADCKNWGPGQYIKKNVLTDPWNSEFVYENAGGKYSIKSLGKDKKEGGEGINADISSDDEK